MSALRIGAHICACGVDLMVVTSRSAHADTKTLGTAPALTGWMYTGQMQFSSELVSCVRRVATGTGKTQCERHYLSARDESYE